MARARARRKRNRTPAEARRDRALLMKEIAREHKRADRARLEGLLSKLRAARAERRRAIASARAACTRRGRFPPHPPLAAELRGAKAEAKRACAADLGRARLLRDAEKRARAEHRAELAHQRAMRRIERGNAAKVRAARARPGLAKIVRSESDDEVRGNIPPELVFLFERVKRQIKGSDRMTRTEAFLKYAEEHPDEELQAIEDKTEAMIREHEARMNPKKKKKRKAKRPKARPNASKHHAHLWDVRMAWPNGSIAATLAAPSAAEARRKARELALSRRSDAPSRITVKRVKRDAIVTRSKNPKPKKKRKKSPRRLARPTARWFDAIVASKVGRRFHRVTGRPNAAWWALPPADREATVRRLLRSRPRVAVALAKAEQRRAGGPRKSNPDHAVPLYALSYIDKKPGDRRPHVYEHVFEGRRPRVVMKGGKLALRGGSQFTKEGWIHG